ncbi:MAG: hypothetical protein OQL19_17080 [Gammaproteobacteria bacterium]|nr:hypothetical protein [Gammaproteobacteria bacterium]
MTDIYYVISEVDRRQFGETHNSTWPQLVAYSFDLKKILITEGHGLIGGSMSLSSFNISDWNDIFQTTNTEWFSDCIAEGTIINLSDEDTFINLLKKKLFKLIDLVMVCSI